MSLAKFDHMLVNSRVSQNDRVWFPRWLRRYALGFRNGLFEDLSVNRTAALRFSRSLLRNGARLGNACRRFARWIATKPWSWKKTSRTYLTCCRSSPSWLHRNAGLESTIRQPKRNCENCVGLCAQRTDAGPNTAGGNARPTLLSRYGKGEKSVAACVSRMSVLTRATFWSGTAKEPRIE